MFIYKLQGLIKINMSYNYQKRKPAQPVWKNRGPVKNTKQSRYANQNYTVSSFLKEVNIYCNQFSVLDEGIAKGIIDNIKEIAIPMNIGITYEHLSNLANGGIRVILSSQKHKANYNVPLVRACNGLIVEITMLNGKVACVLRVLPPRDFNSKPSLKMVNKYVENDTYDIYEVIDGTTVNMYYMNDKWVFSTRRAFDISGIVWRGYSYQTLLEELISQETLDKLNKQHCYSIGFKHPAHHPFQQPFVYQPSDTKQQPDENTKNWYKRVWLIQESDPKKLMCMTPDAMAMYGLETQPRVQGEPSLRELVARANTSLQQYLTNREVKDIGFILRSRNEKHTGAHSDVLIEGSLLQSIRKMIYQLPFTQNRTLRAAQEENFKNFNYVVLESYLEFNKRNLFLELFPQFEQQFLNWENLITTVATKIHELQRYAESQRSSERPNLKYSEILASMTNSAAFGSAEPVIEPKAAEPKAAEPKVVDPNAVTHLVKYFYPVIDHMFSPSYVFSAESPSETNFSKNNTKNVINSSSKMIRVICDIITHPKYTDRFLEASISF